MVWSPVETLPGSFCIYPKMANIKNGFDREVVIDRCLQSRRGYSTQEIMDKVNDTLENRGEKPVTALNTIRNDIMSIENRWHIVVEQIRSGRKIKYRYEDPDFSIYNSPLSEEDIMQLSESVSILRRFNGMPGFEWIDELNARLQSSIRTSSKPVIGFDDQKIQLYKTLKTEVEPTLNDADIILDSYILSNTPYKEVSFWTGDKREVFDENHVLFVMESNYIDELFGKLII